MTLKIEGADELKNQLEEMSSAAREIEGSNEVEFKDLFSRRFMKRYTRFGSIDEFLSESPWEVKSERDLEKIPENEFDLYVSKNTVFDNGDEMVSKAGEEWVAQKLGF